MFWADEIAQKIVERRPDKDVYRVHDYKTPSGRVHVGALKGVVIHSVVARAIAALGKKVEYTYGFDNYDPMDGFPVYLPESFRQYMGMPLTNIPSPEPGFANFADFYAKEFMATYNKMGIFPDQTYDATEMYKSGWYNDAIRQLLDNADKVRTIYKEISGSEKPADWYPLNVICEHCGKVGTTRVYAWDGKEVSYKCEPTMVTWAQGCEHEGKIDPFDGRAALPWKPEWAAKWFLYKEDFETAGKDHMTKNGSFDVSAAIVQEVFQGEEPLGRAYPYEWLLIGGKKMSSSKGTGVSAKDVVEMVPPTIFHFFLARTKPNRHMEFNPEGNFMPMLYDEYDRAIGAYHAEPESDLAKAILYTKNPDHALPEYTLRFSKVAFLVQMPHMDIFDMAEKEKGAPLTDADKAELTERADYAKKWLAEFADDSAKFTLQDSLPVVELSDSQKAYLMSIKEKLNAAEWDGGAIHTILHDAKGDLSPRDAFSALYRIFLNKDQGPQAGWFLAALDKDLVISRLSEATA